MKREVKKQKTKREQFKTLHSKRQMTETKIQNHIKIIFNKNFYFLMKFCFKIMKSINIVHHTNNSREKKNPNN